MHNATVERLARLEEPPAVSIYCPLEQRRPGNDHDPAVLAALRDDAARQVIDLTSENVVGPLLASLDGAIASIDLQHPSAGVAIFVSFETTEVVELDSPVDARLSVDTRFVLLPLVAAMQRRPHARVLVLSQARTRCVDLSGHRAVERHDFGDGATTGEFVFVPRSVDAAEDDGYLMGFVQDPERGAGDLVILSVSAEPVTADRG